MKENKPLTKEEMETLDMFIEQLKMQEEVNKASPLLVFISTLIILLSVNTTIYFLWNFLIVNLFTEFQTFTFLESFLLVTIILIVLSVFGKLFGWIHSKL